MHPENSCLIKFTRTSSTKWQSSIFICSDFTASDHSTQPIAATPSISAEEQADDAGGLNLALVGPGVAAALAILLLLALAIGCRQQRKTQRLRELQQQSIYSTAQGSSIFSIGSGQDIYSSMSLNTMGGYVPYGGNSEMNF